MIKNIALFLLGFIVYTLCHLFVMGDMNVMKWESEWRFLLVFNAMICGGFLAIIK